MDHPEEIISIREYFNLKVENILSLIKSNNEKYEIEFTNVKDNVHTALNAQEKAVAMTFAASEKAITKAEEAQKDYNIRSNEFRGQLDDQAKTLMPRTETINLFKSLEDRLTIIQNNTDKALSGIILDINTLRDIQSQTKGKGSVIDPQIEELIKETKKFNEYKSSNEGQTKGRSDMAGWVIAVIMFIIAVSGFILTYIKLK